MINSHCCKPVKSLFSKEGLLERAGSSGHQIFPLPACLWTKSIVNVNPLFFFRGKKISHPPFLLFYDEKHIQAWKRFLFTSRERGTYVRKILSGKRAKPSVKMTSYRPGLFYCVFKKKKRRKKKTLNFWIQEWDEWTDNRAWYSILLGEREGIGANVFLCILEPSRGIKLHSPLSLVSIIVNGVVAEHFWKASF